MKSIRKTIPIIATFAFLIFFCIIAFLAFSMYLNVDKVVVLAAGEYNVEDFEVDLTPKSTVYSAQMVPYETSVEYIDLPFYDYTIEYRNQTYPETIDPPINAGIYTVIISINGTSITWQSILTIYPKPLYIEYGGASTYQYFGVEFSRNISPIGVIDNEEIGLSYQYVGLKYTLNENLKPINADSYLIEVSITNTNYVITEHTGINPRELIITKAVLTVKAEDLTINEGEIPEFFVTITGFVQGESIDDVVGIPIVICNEDEAGVYSIVPSGGAADNYDLSYRAGLFTINKLIVTTNIDSGEHVFTIAGIFHPDFSLVVESLLSTDDKFIEAMNVVKMRNMATYMDKTLYAFDSSNSEGYATSSRFKIKISNITLEKIFDYKILVVDDFGLVHEITKYNYTSDSISFSSDVLGTVLIVERQLRTYLIFGILLGLTLVIIAFIVLTKLKYQVEKREIENQIQEARAKQNKYRW